MPSGQLAVWNGASFALSTDCRVCPARAVYQACPLSGHLPSVERIERNIENLLAIPGEKQERIFERFHRGTDARKLISRAGLGLYVARNIAAAHGGSLVLYKSTFP
jgi:hypothetical protein